MIKIDPELSFDNFVLDLSDLQEVSFALRTLLSLKISRPIFIIPNLIDYLPSLEIDQLRQKSPKALSDQA